MRNLYLLLLLCTALKGEVQARTIRALFVGNSYTYYNNMPDLISKMALAGGDTLVFESSTPGGHTLQGHTANTTSLSLIARGNWDYVILQEQSQLPAFPDARVARDVYPYAMLLDSLIKKDNNCATTLFYMTWGRKNGDRDNCPGLPWVCTYQGMDSTLQLRYSIMAAQNEAALAPVAKVWRKIRTEYPAMELYDGDESHPSNKGSFAAACAFYAIIFGKDPALNTYNFNLSAADAQIIKDAAKTVVFDNMDEWFRYTVTPEAVFSAGTPAAGTVSFTNASAHATGYLWIFGDGNTSELAAPSHTYTANGQYQVQLVAYRCNAMTDTAVQTVIIDSLGPSGIGRTRTAAVHIYPNPVTDYLTVSTTTGGLQQDITIVDVLGRNMTGWKPVTGEERTLIDVTALPHGVYYLLLKETDGRIACNRFIKR